MDEIIEFLQRILHFPLGRIGNSEIQVLNLIKLAVFLVLLVVGERVFRRVVVGPLLGRTQLQPSSQFAIGRVFGYLLFGLGGYIALTFSGFDVSSFAILAGAVGVGIGFGLQNVVSNFVSGLIILVERPIALGDRVEVGQTAGTVTKISLRSTVIVTNDNISIIVPNSQFIENPVTNWSHGDSKVRIRVSVGVAYGSDVEKLRRVLVEIAVAHPEVLRDPLPQLFFVGFGESSLDFELGVWTSTMARRPSVLRSDLNYAIERCLRENGIEIPFPQRDLHVRSGTLDVRTVVDPR